MNLSMNMNRNKKLIFIFAAIILFFSYLISIYSKAEAGLANSAHDLSNETTHVSCINCHWMHQRGTQDTTGDPKGYRHSLLAQSTVWLCYACHSGKDPNTQPGLNALMGEGILPGNIVFKPTQGGIPLSQGGILFPGQPAGVNVYNVKYAYETAEFAGNGSYHLYYSPTKYPQAFQDTSRPNDKFTCFDCHNHGIYNSGVPGGRLAKLLWSKGRYDSFPPFVGKTGDEILTMRNDSSQYYATEYFCLSCHARNTYPNRMRALDSLYWPIQIDDTAYIFSPTALADIAFFSTKHVFLERYGSDTVSAESRNPYGLGKDISCLVCHNIHASTYPKLMAGNFDQNTMCQQCHSPSSPAPKSDTFEFSYIYETGGQYNYITTDHPADKGYFTTLGHGRKDVSEKGVLGAGLECSSCHGVHGTGHYKMVKLIVADPRGAHDTAYLTTYTLNSTDIEELDSGKVSGFCASACHNPASPVRDLYWWQSASVFATADMPSIYRGKVKFDLSAHNDVFNSAQDKTVCAACHDSHGTPYPALTWNSEETLCFQCHDSTMSKGAPNIKQYFDTLQIGRSHHPVDSAEQTDTKRIECTNCHNPHLVTKSRPVMNPYDWSTTGDTGGYINFATHKGRAGFCLSCHYEYYKDTVKGLGAYPPGVRIDSSSVKLIGSEFADAGHNKRSDTTANYTVLIDCLNCHSPHGSTNPNNILDAAYFDTVDGDTDTFSAGFYNFSTPFAMENTRISRKFCYSPTGESGCHTPQRLTVRVNFPDSLEVDTSHHNARKVPFGPMGSSYYIDEHDPIYDSTDSTPVNGLLGCSVCHYKPHNPTPDYWYDFSAKNAPQYCLDCHRPPAARPSNYETMAKYYGGAPSKYESTYIEFTSGSYLSKHLASVSIDSTTTGYCKKCHGEHTDHNMPGGTFVRRTDIDIATNYTYDTGGKITDTSYTTTYGTFTDHLNTSSFCMSCHKSSPAGTFGAAVAPDIDILYNTSGHGRLSSFLGSLPVYCFDCHTKHSSANPSLLRTEIRDIIGFESARNRSIRTEDLDSLYKKSADVRINGIQYVCFACHTNAGSGYDSSSNSTVNAVSPNPGSALWRGKVLYESAGHGRTRIPGYRDTTYGATATGLSCTWCHEPHGRGTSTVWVFNSTFNDDMLKIDGKVELCLKCHDKVLIDTANNVTISNIKALFDSSVSRHNVYNYSTTLATRIACINCHNPHTGDKEYPADNPNDRATPNTGDDTFCLACHDGTPPQTPYPAVVFGPTSGSGYNKASYESSAHGEGLGGLTVWCRTCHRPHGTNKQYLQREVYDFNQDNIFGGHSYDSIYTVYNDTIAYNLTEYKDEAVCFGCHRNHSGESDWPAEWAGIPDINKLFYNTATGQPRPVTHHNVLSIKQRGADGWSTASTSDDSFLECDNCHNQHVATKSKPITDPDNLNVLLNTTGAELIRFCLRCHDNAPPAGVSRVLQSGKFDNISSLYDPDHNGTPDNFFGHYSQNDGVAFNCLVCHNTHGVMEVDRGLDSSNPAYYNFNIAFYHENTKNSRKFCYSADASYTSGCHVPQYLTTQVTFPGSLGVSGVTRARNVPFGPIGNSYYIDEHNPYYDTTGNTTASGIFACSVCHYKPHRPTPNFWYDSTATGALQNCLDCHRPPAARPAGYETMAKFYGGAPSKFESTYVEFTTVYTTAYISRHLTSAGINATTTGYCKKCHGEHTDHNLPGGTYARRMNIHYGTSGAVDTTQGPFTTYVSSSSFCLSCHQGNTTFVGGNTFGGRNPPDIAIEYNTSGHGKLTSASGSLPVYCYDCHTKHSSVNPYMLRTEIRDLLTYSTVASVLDRNIRVEDLDSSYKKTADIKVKGIQYVCFACHTGQGASYDSSNNDTVNALRPNPGSALWLGKTIYESAGHGMTRIPGFRDTTYGATATGMSCTWCHEPHGRGVNSTDVNWRTAYDSSINDDMLKIEGSVYLCFKCHNQVLNDTANNLVISNIKVLFDSSVSRHNVYSTAVSGARITCLNCHNPHTGDKEYPGVHPDNRTALNVGDDIFCIACHDGTPPTYTGGNPYPDVAFATTSGTGYNKASYESSAHGEGMNENPVWCRTCHKPHGTMKKKLLREIYDFNQDNIVGGHSYDSVYTDTTTYAAYGTAYIDYKDEDVCFGCHRNHTGESDWNTAWVNIPDILRFYKIYDSGTGTYGAKTRSHHPVYADEQRGQDSVYSTSDDEKIECEDCHNQHVATRAKPITDPDSTNRIMSAYGTDCITFCLRCHDNKVPAGIKGLTWGIDKNIEAEYDPDTNGIYENFTGHYRQSDGKPLECRVCHSMHGSNFSKQIREDVVDGVVVNDTGRLVRNMFALTLDSAHLGGNDTLAVSSTVEFCLACHSGKTQFYDAAKGGWQDIPLAPPPGYAADVDTTHINTSKYHPYLLDSSTTSVSYLAYADTGLVRKKVMSIYSTVFNIDTTRPFDRAGCACHGAHNPYKEATSEYADCFNCHNKFANIVDIETQFNRVISKHAIGYNADMFNSTGEVRYMECFKCHIQFEVAGDTTYYHRTGTVVFVDVNSGTTWASRKKGYDNSSKKNVTLFCLSCHNNPLADPDSASAYYGTTANSPYRFTDTAAMKYGGDPVQLRQLDSNDLVQRKWNGKYYYPVDTASAHFDTSFGTNAVISGFSCTDCHDPHGSINNSLLQDFEELADRKDYDRDGSTTRVINYESVNFYKLNEEKFCYFCHDGVFNSTGWNLGKKMKNIQYKFSAPASSRHKVDDAEQALNTTMIECTNCHNPHTARRDRLVVNPKTGERAEFASNLEMNGFCLGCHDTGGPGTTAVIPTNWDSGIKFPNYPVNANNAEWVGNTWNKYNKEAMSWTTGAGGTTSISPNKHYYSSLNVSCASCHDAHGSSNYRMLAEEIVNVFPPYQTTYVSAIILMNQTKPDGRVRVEAYSSFGYSMNRFCFACHKAPMGYDPDYSRNYVYPGETTYNQWDFGTTKSAPYDKVNGSDVVNQYGKDKDCDYCHNPHSTDSLRVHLVRDTVPQDLNRLSATYGNRIADTLWFGKSGDTNFAATGVDFCLSKGCHITDRWNDLGSGVFMQYDQFNLLPYNSTGALPFSGKRPGAFTPDGIKYTTARASKHPIVTYDENRAAGNTLVCISCHTPHGSPGNTELAASYGNTYEATYPQDNAGLRRAYYRSIYWWPATLRKIYDTLGQFNPKPTADRTKIQTQSIPAAGNDICFECHIMTDVIGTVGGKIDTARTRFIGHEAVVGGAKIGVTVGGINNFIADNNDYHKFTCSFCHGPHATTDEKLLTMKCYYSYTSAPSYMNNGFFIQQRQALYYKGARYPYSELYQYRPAGIVATGTGPKSPLGCHPYGGTEWGSNFKGWRTLINTTKNDLDRPSGGIDTLFVYANTTRAYDTLITLPGIGLPVRSNDGDVVLAWRSAYDSGGNNSTWVYAYNIYRGDTSLTKQNKFYKAKQINTWKEWGYTFITNVIDTGYAARPKTNFSTLYTIDPSIAHVLSKRYFYLVVPIDYYGNEAIVENCLDTGGVYFVYDSTPPRPITTLTLTQENQPSTNTIGMRITWQDPGDNIHTNKYTVYAGLVDSSQADTAYLTAIWAVISDTSSPISADYLTAGNFGDFYNTIRYDSNLFNSTAIINKKVYIVGIKASDTTNNTCSVFAFKALRVTDAIPSNITCLAAYPNIAGNLSGSENNYDIGLSWTVPWDNESIPVYKVYRKPGEPVNQADIDNYNIGTTLTNLECVTSLTRYNDQPVSTYGTGTVITYTDNVVPSNIIPGQVYYYAVTPIDVYATRQVNLGDTAYGYYTDRAGYLYREQINPALNTRLLEPINGMLTNFVRTNTRVAFDFNPAVYDTARFKQYNFYRRYETSKVWVLGTSPQTLWINSGVDSLQANYPAGNYYYAASIKYNSTYITIGGDTRWLTNIESPLNLISTVFVADLIPPAPFVFNAAFVPAKENGYDTIKLSWSGGTDTANFKNCIITQMRGDGGEIAASESGLSALWHMNDNWNEPKNANDFTAINGATFSSSGKFGTACGSFDGVDDYVYVPDSDFLKITGDLTIEFWLYPQNIGTNRINPIDKAYWGEYSFTIETDGSLSYYHGDGSNYISFTALPSGSIKNNQWVHIALTRDNTGKVLKGYKNGQLVSTASGYSYNPSATTEPLKAGAGYTGFGYQGRIDEAAIYNRVLTAEEIFGHSAGGIAVSSYTDMSASTFSIAAPSPSIAWQSTNSKYGAFRYSYKITSNDSALNYTEAVTNLATRPPSYNNMNFAVSGLTFVEGIRVSWANMLQYSETANYGPGGYKVYGKKTSSGGETINHIFLGTTLNVDTAYGVRYLGAVTADTTGSPTYPKENQALYGTTTASSFYSVLFRPSNVNDSSLITSWSSAEYDTFATTFIELDLGTDKVIDKVVYDNYGDGLQFEPLDTAQGYTILTASRGQYLVSFWETLADKPNNTPRQRLVFERARNGIRYIRATNFSRPDTAQYPIDIFEIETYYPNDTATTSFDHLKTNPNLSLDAGGFYTYGLTLEDKIGTKSTPVFLPKSISVLDIFPPGPIFLNASLVPAQENGYNTLSLSWSGGQDSNFRNFTITKIKHDSTEVDTVVATIFTMSTNVWTSVVPSPSWAWQTATANQKYGAFKYTYRIRSTDSANLYSETTVSFVTRPPSYNMNFAGQQMAGVAGNRLTWNNMLLYSESTNYGVGGYKIYGKKTNNQTDTLNHIFYGTTFNVDTAYGVVKLGEVTADTTGLPSYSTVNQASSAYVTASTSFSGSYPPSNAKDNSIYTLWRAATSDTSAYIQLDFGSDKVIEKISYNNFGNTTLAENVQGYTILAASSSQYGSTWETVANKPNYTPRQTFVFQRPRTGIRYIRAANFSRSGTSDTTISPATVFEIGAYYPNDTTTTSFNHLATNGNLTADAGKFYAYGVTLENKNGIKGTSVFLPSSISVLDIEPPNSVIDLIAYGDTTYVDRIFLKWSQPYDNLGVKWYEVWRRYNSSDILSTVSASLNNYNLGTTYAVNYVDYPQQGVGPYFYAIAAMDTTGNKSKFAGKNYSAGASLGLVIDSLPPEPVTLTTYKFDTASGNWIQLIWSQALDRKDYNTLFQEDTTLYGGRITQYFVYRVDYSLDTTAFSNRLKGVSATFDSGYNTLGGQVANGWKAGTWGGVTAPVILPSIDTAQGGCQKLNIYNYVGDPREQIGSSTNVYIKTAAYIKTAGYQFDTSQDGSDTLAVRYVFGTWLKAEGSVSGQPYVGRVYLDIGTNLNTGNESTFITLGRRELISPSQNWKYYMINLRMPSTAYSSTENGVMIWATSNGNIWLDNAELIRLGKPVGAKSPGSELYNDYDVLPNRAYYYAVTALDISNNPSKNEGRFANIGIVTSDLKVPVFDTTMFTSPEVDINPADPADGNKTGTTPSIRNMLGVNPYDTANHVYDSDNIFRNGDAITLQFRMLEPDTAYPLEPELNILPGGALEGDFVQVDPYQGEYMGGTNYDSGIYSFYYQITPLSYLEWRRINMGETAMVPREDTPYNTVLHKYDSLYRIRVVVRDRNGNGPTISSDYDLTDNNPDTTFLSVLDNTAPSYPE